MGAVTAEVAAAAGTRGPSVTSAMDSATSRASAASPRIAATSAMGLGTLPATAVTAPSNQGEMGGGKHQNSTLGPSCQVWAPSLLGAFWIQLENFNIYINWL